MFSVIVAVGSLRSLGIRHIQHYSAHRRVYSAVLPPNSCYGFHDRFFQLRAPYCSPEAMFGIAARGYWHANASYRTPNDGQNKLFSCHPRSISIFLMNSASRLTVWASALYGTFVLIADIVNCSETARSYICQVMVPVVQNKRASPMYYLVISASITAKSLRNRAAFKMESTQIRNHHQVDDPESLPTPGGTKLQTNTSQWHPSMIGQRIRKMRNEWLKSWTAFAH
jgi:hypothetical protein